MSQTLYLDNQLSLSSTIASNEEGNGDDAPRSLDARAETLGELASV